MNDTLRTFGIFLDLNFFRISWYLSYLGTADNGTISKFNDIIVGLNNFEFGSFDEFATVRNINLADLDHINLTELYKRVRAGSAGNIFAEITFISFFSPTQRSRSAAKNYLSSRAGGGTDTLTVATEAKNCLRCRSRSMGFAMHSILFWTRTERNEM